MRVNFTLHAASQHNGSPSGAVSAKEIVMRPSRFLVMMFILLVLLGMVSTSAAQTFTTLLSFDGTDGQWPYLTSLIQGTDGKLYGVTYEGGDSISCSLGCGTVFRFTLNGSVTRLYSFARIDGAGPAGALAPGTDGNFYGTTQFGGAGDQGTVFKITSRGALTTLYSFCSQANCSDGAYVNAGLIQATDGNWYGTTFGGGNIGCGNYGCGTVFRITPSGQLTTLYAFPASSPSSGNPSAGLIQGRDGNLYGTSTGSAIGQGSGTVFKIALSGAFTTLHQFGSGDGIDPQAGLVQGTDGNFYGTTPFGGSNNSSDCGGVGCGTVFKMTPSGTVTTIYNFCGEANCTDGTEPFSPLIQATDGTFYGMTNSGGTFSGGVIFSITSSGAQTVLHSFAGPDGGGSYSGLVQDTNGVLYGTTSSGGSSGDGTAFSLNLGLHPFVNFVRSVGRTGAVVGIRGQGFTGTTAVSFNGAPATYNVNSDTLLTAVVPSGATTGKVVVTTPGGKLTSNVSFKIIQ